jgi:HAE1 family hydrophobic/amphiphilic exporter-1
VVFGGLLVATFLSTLVVPVFYVVMKTLIGESKSKTTADTSSAMS